MRALNDVPQFEQALSEGRLSLSTLSSVQNHCRVEKVSVQVKAGLIEQVLGKSQRETDRLLATLAPQTFKKEKTRPLDDELTELRIALTKDQMAVLEKARAKFSHRAKNWAELLELLASDAVKDPKPRKLVVAKVESKVAAKGAPTGAAWVAARVSPAVATALSATSAQKLRSRHIPRAIKRDHFARSGHRCEFVDPTTKRRCEATHFLELDHVKPLAFGGTTTRDNLRVLCRAHNQWHALKSFGHKKMQQHWGR
jgi:5-methylcytosine-specific restriction endonuclease McrA